MSNEQGKHRRKWGGDGEVDVSYASRMGDMAGGAILPILGIILREGISCPKHPEILMAQAASFMWQIINKVLDFAGVDLGKNGTRFQDLVDETMAPDKPNPDMGPPLLAAKYMLSTSGATITAAAMSCHSVASRLPSDLLYSEDIEDTKIALAAISRLIKRHPESVAEQGMLEGITRDTGTPNTLSDHDNGDPDSTMSQEELDDLLGGSNDSSS